MTVSYLILHGNYYNYYRYNVFLDGPSSGVTGHSGCISRYVGRFFGTTHRVAPRRVAPRRAGVRSPGFSAIQAE